ncbi:MAG: GNAT family N-acetyltransferase [Ilumatobacter sp.]|jgi:GNAT superfamily N-acetyltransferase|uniref:GNAT family N-acetyltransferase n=1 Tax=Ilumatobacter sp. TaxID=1967498 RepID=UPI00391A867F
MSDSDIVSVGARSGLAYRHIREEWADRLEAVEHGVFSTADPDHLCSAAQFADMARRFPEGCFIGFDGDEIVAVGTGIRTHFDLAAPLHTIDDILTDDGCGHEPDGRWYYGITIAVLESHRRRGIGNELYELRKAVCAELGLDGIVAGGVIPGFADHKHEMTADEYIDAVRRGDLVDPTLTFQLSNGFDALCALPGYLHDPKVDSFASCIVWRRPADATT